MINESEMMRFLVSACPSFAERWAEWISDEDYDPALVYVDVGELAHHLVELLKQGHAEDLPSVFTAVEQLYENGDDDVRGVLTVGFMEDLQMEMEFNGLDYGLITPYLGQSSRTGWHAALRYRRRN
ncbi:MAG TPA: hypothetical protein VGK99_05995 [Acidobacteriota bacterium]